MVTASANRFVVLDSLRGIAALVVVGFHLDFTSGLFSWSFFRSGYFAVDFFFVLSGFVIAGSYGDKLQAGMPLARFMGLRLGRLYPLHLFALAVFVAMEFVSGLPQLAGLGLQEPFTGTQSPENLVAAVFLVQGFGLPNANGWNVASWSISVEVWLYLAAAVTWRLAGARGWMFGLTAAVGTALVLILTAHDQAPPISLYMLRGLLGFGLGLCCWEFWHRYRPALSGLGEVTIAEPAVIALAILAVQVAPESMAKYAIVSPAFALVVLVFAIEGGIVSRLLGLPVFVWLGTLSYSIYLMHGMVNGWSLDVLRYFDVAERTVQPNGKLAHVFFGGALAANLAGLGLMLLGIVAAWFTWRFVEEPCRRWSRRRFGAPRPASE